MTGVQTSCIVRTCSILTKVKSIVIYTSLTQYLIDVYCLSYVSVVDVNALITHEKKKTLKLCSFIYKPVQ